MINNGYSEYPFIIDYKPQTLNKTKALSELHIEFFWRSMKVQ